jgi:5'-nucleotidase
LWAAAEALSDVGYVWVVAPREQSTSMGRSMPPSSDGIITINPLTVHGKEWEIYAVGGTPAQAVQHGILEIIQDQPDLVVSGINYGVNLGMGITVSGTVGAAMEGASHDIPSLAVSLETAKEFHFSHSKEIDFSTAAYFTAFFARKMLNGGYDPSVNVLKVDVPAGATPETDWAITRLSPVRYYIPNAPQRDSWEISAPMDYELEEDLSRFPQDSDVYVVLRDRLVSVTPINLDMTARVDFQLLDEDIRKD